MGQSLISAPYTLPNIRPTGLGCMLSFLSRLWMKLDLGSSSGALSSTLCLTAWRFSTDKGDSTRIAKRSEANVTRVNSQA